MNFGLNLLMGMRFGGGAPTVPITSAFTYTDIGGGVAGIVNITTDVTKAFMYSGGRGVWAGKITGTEATLNVLRTGGTNPVGLVQVSVDGSTFSNAAKPALDFVLFTGLTDTTHDVIVKYGDAYAEKPYILKSGDIMTVTGAAPAVTVSGSWTTPLDTITETTFAGVQGNASPANFSPAYVLNGAYGKSLTLKTSATEMQVFNVGTSDVHVSIDGAPDTVYTTATNPSVTIIPLDGVLHTYSVWAGSGVLQTSGMMSVGVNSSFVAVPAAKSLIQFGDSITKGVGATDDSYVDTFRLAAAFGYNGLTLGVPGETTVELDTRLTTDIPKLTATFNTGDVIVVATGRNDGAWTPTIASAYSSIISKLRAVYGTVICRGVLPDGVNDFSSENTGISDAVTAAADANVIYINVDSWSGIATADGTHPTDAGYDTIEGYAITAYAPYL